MLGPTDSTSNTTSIAANSLDTNHDMSGAAAKDSQFQQLLGDLGDQFGAPFKNADDLTNMPMIPMPGTEEAGELSQAEQDEIYQVAYDAAYDAEYDIAYDAEYEVAFDAAIAEGASENDAENMAEDMAENAAEDAAENAGEDAGERAVKEALRRGDRMEPMPQPPEGGVEPMPEPPEGGVHPMPQPPEGGVYPMPQPPEGGVYPMPQPPEGGVHPMPQPPNGGVEPVGPYPPMQPPEAGPINGDNGLDQNGDGFVDEFEEYGLPPLPPQAELDRIAASPFGNDGVEVVEGVGVFLIEFDNGHTVTMEEFFELTGKSIDVPAVVPMGDHITTRQELDSIIAAGGEPIEMELGPQPPLDDLDPGLDINGDGVVDKYEEYGLPPLPPQEVLDEIGSSILGSMHYDVVKGQGSYLIEFENGHIVSLADFFSLTGKSQTVPADVPMGDKVTTESQLQTLMQSDPTVIPTNISPIPIQEMIDGLGAIKFRPQDEIEFDEFYTKSNAITDTDADE